MRQLHDQLRARLVGCESVADAAQIFCSALYARFEPSLPLVRVYVSTPFSAAPRRVRSFAKKIVEANGGAVWPSLQVLTLMGTSGVESTWNDPEMSKCHVAIPLHSREFINSMPMIANLVKEMNGEQGIEADAHGVLRLNGLAGLFHIEDAATARDPRGRAIIPATDFVTKYKIQSVFAIGGSYFDSTFATAIFFTRSRLDRRTAAHFTPLIHTFKAATNNLVARQRRFALEELTGDHYG